MTHRKKLIEVALPLEAINVASAREKSIRHGHPSTLHLWWARRPLAAARAVIFTSLVDDPDDPDALPAFVEACNKLPVGANVHANGDTPRMRLFDFIERLVTWEATTDETILNTARELIMIATEGNPPPLLDPFAGGGSIPLEAQRLGLEAHASDLNPVAVMINKAQIEIPPRFANMPPVNPRDREKMFGSGDVGTTNGASDTTWRGAAGLAADVRYYGEWMREKAWERIGHLYPTHNGETVIAWIWARTVKSPNPAVDVHVPLVRSFELSKKKGNEAWIEPSFDSTSNQISFVVHKGKGKVPDGTVNRGTGRCIVTGVPIPADYIKQEARAGRMRAQLMAIVTEGGRNRNYYSANLEHANIAYQATPSWVPSGEIADDPRALTCKLYGLTDFSDLFTQRQLVALTTFIDLIREVREEVYKDSLVSISDTNARNYAEAVSVYLTFAVNKGANYWSSLCAWYSSKEIMMSTFGRQALPMVWDFTEANPFSASSGNFLLGVDQATKSLDNAPNSIVGGFATQHNAMDLLSSAPKGLAISTDPPYYDSVPYSNLADFFYVWLRPALRDIYPEMLGTVLTPKSEELVAAVYRLGTKEQANDYFEAGLQRAFNSIKCTNSPFPISIYYAFKQSEVDILEDDEHVVSSTGWETMLEGLVGNGFHIKGTWPIRTEQSGGLRTYGRNSLASSIVLVCRPRPENAPNSSRRAFMDDLRRELPAALKEMQSGNIAPVDLAQASIGPGMAIYSRYSKVLEADGTPMSVRTALGLINAALDEYLAEQDGDIDPDTRFAVDWFTQFGFNEGDFGQADVLARAKNTSVSGVEAAGVVVSGRGKVRLKHWSEYDPGAWDPTQDKRPTVWEATHHLIERLNSHGETGSAMLMQKMPSDMAAEARQLAYRLYSICERKSWADHARDYNALVISWSGIGEEAARLRDAAEQGEATEQRRLFE